jgi:uncharacterized protein (DUF885 family)
VRSLIILLLSAVAVFAHAEQTADVYAQETARLNTWLDAQYQEELAFSPMSLTRLGSKDLYDQIDDYSEIALDAKFTWREGSIAELKDQFDVNKLNAEGKTSYHYWIYRLERARAGLAYRRHDYIFEQMNSKQTSFPQFLINEHAVESDSDMQAYIARIDGSARALNQLLERAQIAAQEGIRPPRFAYQAVIEESRNLIASAPFVAGSKSQSALWVDANSKIMQLQTDDLINEERAAQLRDATRAALVGSFKKSYESLIAWFEKDLPNSDKEPRGAHALPNGDAYYAYRLAYNTTTDKTAEQVHAIGLAEVARIRTEMEAIMEETGFKGDLPAFFDFVRDDKQFYFSDDGAGRAKYIALTEDMMERTSKLLPQYFGILPKAALEVKRVEAFRERAGGAAHYQKGRPNGSVPGTYYLHLSDMTALNSVVMQSTAYHEGVPGHHMQLSIALESATLPTFRTSVWYSAYGEGWALYSELLSKEMGVYDDLYYDFGRLVDEMWRAIRLVVDTGMHAKGWSEQQGVDYFMANAAVPEVKVRNEIQRYIVWPGQATSYKMGMLNILALRANARAALGDDFDIRGFHDVILGGGSLPHEILAKQVDNWVQQQLL